MEKVNIESFKGINVNIRPDLIEDNQASDMVNLRFNRLGALVNRNGSIAYDVPNSFAAQPEGLDARGCIAIGEFILVEQDNNSTTGGGFGTDRFMVYGLRRNATIAGTDKHAMLYVMVPLTGAYKNRITSGIYAKAFTTQDTAAGNPGSDLLAAPDRRLENLDEWQDDLGVIYDQNWIEHYGVMNQYRDMLVISDKTNGDMLLTDRFNETQYDINRQHKFQLRENAKSLFNVDDVVIDYGLNTGGFNAEGVKHGLALYRYYLPRKKARVNNDHFTDFFGGGDSDTLEKVNRMAFGGRSRKGSSDTNATVSYANNGTFITAAHNTFDTDSSGFWRAAGMGINKTNEYTFSDIKEAVEIDDIHGQLSFKNAASTDKDEAASDVYIWEDVQMTYYPCSGKIENSNYLRAADRDFTKTTPLLPRVEKLKTKTGIEQDVPLAVWRYKFVWDFGNGDYSNPSAELPVPDMLWSVQKDETIKAENNDVYKRPMLQDANSLLKQPILTPLPAANKHYGMYAAPAVFDSEGNLTDYGKAFKSIKDILYAGTSHRFAQYRTTAGYTFEQIAEFGVVQSAKFGSGGDTLQCAGFVFEGARVRYQEIMTREKIKLTVPLFRAGWQEGYNSVFADNGTYRAAWQNRPGYTTYDATIPAWQIVLWGQTIPRKITGYDNGGEVANNVLFDLLYGSATNGIWFNIVPLKESAPGEINRVEQNNIAGQDAERIYTQFRAVKLEPDRLTNIATSIPVEVSSRLILQGTSELILADTTMPGTVCNATNYYGLRELDHSAQRFYQILFDDTEQHWHYGMRPDGTEDHSSGVYCETAQVGGRRVVQNTNVTVAIHGEGERLTIPEQLTSFVPSSLLFRAPHIKLRVEASKIPPRAKKLLIFRTVASHDNNWSPTNFGKVKEVDVSLNHESGGEDFLDLEFLDDVSDKDLDFSLTPSEFQGLTHPLKSRFNIPINEVMYYGNITETYQPPALRSRKSSANAGQIVYWETGESQSRTLLNNNTSWTRIGQVQAGTSRDVIYALLGKDASGIYASPAFIGADSENLTTMHVNGTEAIVLINCPQPSGLIDEVEVWRGTYTDKYKWELIGSIDKGMEGIFADINLKGLREWDGALNEDTGLIAVTAFQEDIPSGLRCSEPYQPNFIKLTNLYPVRHGDGDIITGLEQVAGNLIVFKERSMHRIAIQSSNPPFSRIDEISNRIGCIAPNTVISINGEIYFLSWGGFYKFNNNVPMKADGDFWAELEQRINNFAEVNDKYGNPRNPAVRDASTAYNPVYNELYLNVPIYREGELISPDVEVAPNKSSRKMHGHIYVIQLDTNLVTKFHYEQQDESVPDRTQGRLYHTNSLGELRSAQVLPEDMSRPSLICIDAPTTDETDSTSTVTLSGTDWHFARKTIHEFWRSKVFTLQDKSIVKRVTKFIANVRNGSNITLSGGSQNEVYGSYTHEATKLWSYTFDVTGELEAVPPRTATAPPADFSKHPERGERIVLQIDSDGTTMIDNAAMYWRPVQPFNR